MLSIAGETTTLKTNAECLSYLEMKKDKLGLIVYRRAKNSQLTLQNSLHVKTIGIMDTLRLRFLVALRGLLYHRVFQILLANP